MPALDGSNLGGGGPSPDAISLASKLPLVRVVVPPSDPRKGREVEDVLRTGIIRASHKSARSRDVERRLGAPDAIYFHAGRTHPEYGHVALVLAPLSDSAAAQEATPFGLGGLLCDGVKDTHTQGGCISPIAHEPEATQAAFYADSNWSSDWRMSAAHFLDIYFLGRLRDYFRDAATSKPSRPDPDKIYSDPANTDWRTWTMEVRVPKGDLDLNPLLDADRLLYWAIDEHLGSTLEILATSGGRSLANEYPFYSRLLTMSNRRIISMNEDVFLAVDKTVEQYCFR